LRWRSKRKVKKKRFTGRTPDEENPLFRQSKYKKTRDKSQHAKIIQIEVAQK
jgi:hypothetical protein